MTKQNVESGMNEQKQTEQNNQRQNERYQTTRLPTGQSSQPPQSSSKANETGEEVIAQSATKGTKGTKSHSRFAIVSDGGIDVLESLNNQIPIAPLTINFGNTKYEMYEMPREELFERLKTDPVHPHSAPPTLDAWADAFLRTGADNVLAITMSHGMSLSAEHARAACHLTDQNVRVHNSHTVSAAQAFQVHAACVAAAQGVNMNTAIRWMQIIHEETDLYFTLSTLEYLQKGGRIGTVQAVIGGILNIKPIITVDKTTGSNTNIGRTFSFSRAKRALVDQITRRYGEGTPLRVAMLYGLEREDAEETFEILKGRHPIIWHDFVGTNAMLSIHIGTRAAGMAVAPHDWPWNRGEDMWWRSTGYVV